MKLNKIFNKLPYELTYEELKYDSFWEPIAIEIRLSDFFLSSSEVLLFSSLIKFLGELELIYYSGDRI